MRTKRMKWMIPVAVVLMIVPIFAAEAAAGLRVTASVRTPHLDIRIGHGPGLVREGCLRPPLRAVIRIDKQDRRIAKRLARYTGVSKRELLGMRRAGYRWVEIGHYLNVSRRVVWAAAEAKNWRGFIRMADRGGRRAGGNLRRGSYDNDRDGWND